MDALKRLKAAKVVVAADSDDAAKIVKLLEQAFGAGDTDEEVHGVQDTVWETREFNATLASSNKDFYFEITMYGSDHSEIATFDVRAKDFASFKTKLASAVKDCDRKVTSDLKELQQKVKETEKVSSMLHKLK